MIGAPALVAMGANRAGSGLVKIACPDPILNAIWSRSYQNFISGSNGVGPLRKFCSSCQVRGSCWAPAGTVRTVRAARTVRTAQTVGTEGRIGNEAQRPGWSGMRQRSLSGVIRE
jgi:hypothetical protein